MMAVPLRTEPEFSHGQPQELFENPRATHGRNYGQRKYDVSPDGQHFVMVERREQARPPTELVVWVNWSRELR